MLVKNKNWNIWGACHTCVLYNIFCRCPSFTLYQHFLLSLKLVSTFLVLMRLGDSSVLFRSIKEVSWGPVFFVHRLNKELALHSVMIDWASCHDWICTADLELLATFPLTPIYMAINFTDESKKKNLFCPVSRHNSIEFHFYIVCILGLRIGPSYLLFIVLVSSPIISSFSSQKSNVAVLSYNIQSQGSPALSF